jgi:hypothetical protein
VFQEASGQAPRVVPEKQYVDFYEHRRPPSGVQIWIGRRAREGAWPYRFLSLGGDWNANDGQSSEPVAPVDFNVYQSSLMVGYLVVYISGWLDRGGPLVHSADFRAALIEIWPSKPQLAWPPTAQVDYGRLEAMFNMTGRYVDRAT